VYTVLHEAPIKARQLFSLVFIGLNEAQIRSKRRQPNRGVLQGRIVGASRAMVVLRFFRPGHIHRVLVNCVQSQT
jgi:hypothetical protein